MSTQTSQSLPLVTPRRLVRHILFNALVGGAVCVHGGAGVGKSDIVNGLGTLEELRRIVFGNYTKATGKVVEGLPNLRVVHYTIPQMDAEDFIGVPRHVELGDDDFATVSAPVLDFRPKDGLPFILFLDEVKAADVRVQKVLLQLVNEQKIANVSLPPGTLVVMATNRAEDRAALKSMPFPLANRALHVELGVSATDWLLWAEEQGIHAAFRAFVREHGEAALWGYDPDLASDAQLTPRSYTKTAQIVAAAQELMGMDDLEMEEEIFGRIGKGKGIQLVTFLKLRDVLPSWHEITEKGIKAKLPEQGNLSQSYYVASMLLENFKRKIEPAKLKNAMAYLQGIIESRPEAVDAVGWVCAEVAGRATGDAKGLTQADVEIATETLNAAGENRVVAEKITSFLQRASR